VSRAGGSSWGHRDVRLPPGSPLRRTRRAGGEGRGDRGGSTVLAVAAAGVLLMVLVGGLALASAVTAGRRAESAADLASLGGAVSWAAGSSAASACARGQQVAARNGALLVECVVAPDGSVTVTATVHVGLVLPAVGGHVARARARAGPGPAPADDG
jgi:secretion/DNA translocation related TadE-like protein